MSLQKGDRSRRPDGTDIEWNGFEWIDVARIDAVDAFLAAAEIPAEPSEGPPAPLKDLRNVEDLARVFEDLLGEVEPEPSRSGIVETPMRAAKAWMHWTGGYHIDPASVLKTFEDGASGCDQMVVVKDIPFYSHCEHHLAPIFGTATVGYLPNGKIVGLSKLNRLVDVFARRLQVQERLTNQVADALMKHLEPAGVGVLIRARHFCMESRGVQHQGCETVTSALHGVFRDDPTVRAEFLDLARNKR